MAFTEKRFSRILFRSVARVLMIGEGKVTWRSSLDGLNCLYLGTVQYLGEIRATEVSQQPISSEAFGSLGILGLATTSNCGRDGKLGHKLEATRRAIEVMK
jgi:hypothetical protein